MSGNLNHVRIWSKYALIISIVIGLSSFSKLSYISPFNKEAYAQALSSQQYRIKAAFIYNFSKFIEWPSQAFTGPEQPFSIGILGEDPFGQILEETLEDKTVKGRSFVINRSDNIKNLEKSHIIFISGSEKGRLPEVIDAIQHKHVLTVSDMENFSRSGGMIQLVKLNKTIRFEINLDAANRARIEINAKLLSLGIILRD